MIQNFVALNTTFKKSLENRTPSDHQMGKRNRRRNKRYSTDAEANDMTHLGSDRRSVIAHARFPCGKKKGILNNKYRNDSFRKSTRCKRHATSIETSEDHPQRHKRNGQHEAATHEESKMLQRKHTTTTTAAAHEESEILERQHTTKTAATIEDGVEVLEQHTLTTAAAAQEESQILERKHMKTMTAATRDEEEIFEQLTMKTAAATNDESEILEQQQATRAEACGDDGSSHKGRD